MASRDRKKVVTLLTEQKFSLVCFHFLHDWKRLCYAVLWTELLGPFFNSKKKRRERKWSFGKRKAKPLKKKL